MNEPLLEELTIVQNDYLSLLKELAKNRPEDISLSMIDSINIFWYENRNIVNLAFEYLFKGKDTYCFSAATIFDVDDEDQNSFFLLGDYHVFDDPIPSYINSLIRISDTNYLSKMKDIISNTIKDNIKIIEDRESGLIILPLRYISVLLNKHSEKLDETAENLFLNMFTGIKNLQEYESKIVTVKDINNNLDNNNSLSIRLFNGDNPNETWEFRMREYQKKNNHFDMSGLSSGSIFYLVVFGHIRQAFALIDMVDTFEVLPFIRSFIALHYYILLTSMIEYNFNGEKEFPQVNYNLSKTKISYFLYQEFRKRENKISIDELKQKAVNIDFETELLSDIENLEENKHKMSETIKVINKYLDQIENS